MKLVHWKFQNLDIGMIEVEVGKLYCTTPALTKALMLSEQAIRQTYYNNKVEFNPLRTNNFGSSDLSTLIQEHKAALGLTRVRQDLLLWPEEDAFTMAVLSRSQISRRFRKELWQFCQQYALRNYVNIEQYRGLTEENTLLQQRLDQLEQKVDTILGVAKESASLAGKQLQLTKQYPNLVH